MKLTDFNVLTFDCYGTLIDWETGIHTALLPLLGKGNLALSKDDALAIFAKHESAQQHETPDLLYPELLTAVHGRMAQEWSIPVSAEENQRFGASVPDWPAFPDSVASLRYLKQHYKLVILSNVDRESFAGSNRRLEVEFDAIYTAQDVGSYKPNLRNFEYMLAQLAEMGVEKDDILHTAQSLYHDHLPATKMGLTRAWIDRRKDNEGWGATSVPDEEVQVDFHFGSLAAFVDEHREL